MKSLADCKDDRLVQQTREGDRQAYAELLARHQHKVRGIICIYISDEDAVADLTQDVFIKAYECLHEFKHDSHFSTWLYRIAINKIKNYYRSNNMRSDCEIRYMRESLKATLSPENDIISAEFGARVLQAFSKLPYRLKRCGLLALKGHSYEEIADRLHCPVGTVRSRIHRARHFVLDSLELKG